MLRMNVHFISSDRIVALVTHTSKYAHILWERVSHQNNATAAQDLYATELRMHSSPCSSNAQCKLNQRCDQFACLGVALNSPCETSADCGNAQLCKSKKCVAMVPPPGSPCTSECPVAACFESLPSHPPFLYPSPLHLLLLSTSTNLPSASTTSPPAPFTSPISVSANAKITATDGMHVRHDRFR